MREAFSCTWRWCCLYDLSFTHNKSPDIIFFCLLYNLAQRGPVEACLDLFSFSWYAHTILKSQKEGPSWQSLLIQLPGSISSLARQGLPGVKHTSSPLITNKYPRSLAA